MTLLDDDVQADLAPAEPQAPDERLDPRVELLWQVNAALGWIVWISLAAVALFVFDRSPAWASLMAPVAATYVMQVPTRRYRHFVFRVGPADVRVAHGWLWRTESVVLHSRIQHVDTRQGPVERMMGLATVVIFTAGSVGAMVAIPGLATARAEALRDELVRLSGTDDAV
ncbi:MAG TPA: PH domain-containing protein [Longimicrobium sp.]|nr:PH domain-containing protein [Longimicrobium sp.]